MCFTCKPGWVGERCDLGVGCAEIASCKNGGTPKENPKWPLQYGEPQCMCSCSGSPWSLSGFTGRYCEKKACNVGDYVYAAAGDSGVQGAFISAVAMRIPTVRAIKNIWDKSKTIKNLKKAKKGLGYFEWAKACTWDLFGSNNERGKCVDATVSNVAEQAFDLVCDFSVVCGIIKDVAGTACTMINKYRQCHDPNARKYSSCGTRRNRRRMRRLSAQQKLADAEVEAEDKATFCYAARTSDLPETINEVARLWCDFQDMRPTLEFILGDPDFDEIMSIQCYTEQLFNATLPESESGANISISETITIQSCAFSSKINDTETAANNNTEGGEGSGETATTAPFDADVGEGEADGDAGDGRNNNVTISNQARIATYLERRAALIEGSFAEAFTQYGRTAQTAIESSRVYYQKLAFGACLDKPGRRPINSTAECSAASKRLRLGDESVTTTTTRARPEGCYWYTDGNLILNTNADSLGNGADGKRQPICRMEGSDSIVVNLVRALNYTLDNTDVDTADQCRCSGLINSDSGGGPSCTSRDSDDKRYCYTELGVCADAALSERDDVKGKAYSNLACNKDCRCNSKVNSDGNGADDCTSISNGRAWCYTNSTVCADGQVTSKVANAEWSYDACVPKPSEYECTGYVVSGSVNQPDLNGCYKDTNKTLLGGKPRKCTLGLQSASFGSIDDAWNLDEDQPLRSVTLDECVSACAAAESCIAFTREQHKMEPEDYGYCSLKKGGLDVGGAATDTGDVTYIAKCPDLWGGGQLGFPVYMNENGVMLYWNKAYKWTNGFICRNDRTIRGTANVPLSTGKMEGAGYTEIQCVDECRRNSKCMSFVYTPVTGYCELWADNGSSSSTASGTYVCSQRNRVLDFECDEGSTITGTADVLMSSGNTSDLGYTKVQCAEECKSNAICAEFVFNPTDGYCELWSGKFDSGTSNSDTLVCKRGPGETRQPGWYFSDRHNVDLSYRGYAKGSGWTGPGAISASTWITWSESTSQWVKEPVAIVASGLTKTTSTTTTIESEIVTSTSAGKFTTNKQTTSNVVNLSPTSTDKGQTSKDTLEQRLDLTLEQNAQGAQTSQVQDTQSGDTIGTGRQDPPPEGQVATTYNISESTRSKSISSGEVAGIVIGLLLFALVILTAVCWNRNQEFKGLGVTAVINPAYGPEAPTLYAIPMGTEFDNQGTRRDSTLIVSNKSSRGASFTVHDVIGSAVETNARANRYAVPMDSAHVASGDNLDSTLIVSNAPSGSRGFIVHDEIGTATNA